jgi:hypothetical protein
MKFNNQVYQLSSPVKFKPLQSVKSPYRSKVALPEFDKYKHLIYNIYILAKI